MAVYTARVAAVSLTAATAKTLVQIVPGSNVTVRIIEVGISFDSTTSSEAPVAVDLMRQTTAGTSSSLTLVADQESNSKAAVATALQTFSAEPTAGNVLRTWHVTPVGGLLVIQFPLGREPDALTNRIALRANAPSTETVTAYITFEE